MDTKKIIVFTMLIGFIASVRGSSPLGVYNQKTDLDSRIANAISTKNNTLLETSLKDAIDMNYVYGVVAALGGFCNGSCMIMAKQTRDKLFNVFIQNQYPFLSPDDKKNVQGVFQKCCQCNLFLS